MSIHRTCWSGIGPRFASLMLGLTGGFLIGPHPALASETELRRPATLAASALTLGFGISRRLGAPRRIKNIQAVNDSTFDLYVQQPTP